MSDHRDASRVFVLFRLGQAEFGLPVTSVASIIRYEKPTSVPRSSAAVLGVINLRGRVIPVLDLGLRFAGEPFVAGPLSRIIVAEGHAGPLGIAVDLAVEVASFCDEQIKAVPEDIVGAEAARAFSGMIERPGGLLMLLDLEEAIPHSEYADAQPTDELEEMGRNA